MGEIAKDNRHLLELLTDSSKPTKAPLLGSASQCALPFGEDARQTRADFTSARPLFSVAPPVDGLNVLRMVVSPCPSHAAGIDVIGYDVAIVAELFIAEKRTRRFGQQSSCPTVLRISAFERISR